MSRPPSEWTTNAAILFLIVLGVGAVSAGIVTAIFDFLHWL